CAIPTFRQMSGTVSPLARSRSASRRICATSWAVLRLLMSPSVAQSTGGLPFRLDQILGSSPQRLASALLIQCVVLEHFTNGGMIGVDGPSDAFHASLKFRLDVFSDDFNGETLSNCRVHRWVAVKQEPPHDVPPIVVSRHLSRSDDGSRL